MKRYLTPAVTLNPSAGTLDLSAIPGFDVRRLGVVIDLKTGGMIYGPLAGFGVSAVASGVLTLQASLAGTSSTDLLMVLYDDSTGKVAEDTSVQAAVTALNALINDVANNHADLSALHTDLSSTLHVDLAAILSKLGSSPAQTADIQAVVTKLGSAPAQSSDVQAVVTKLGTSPAQSADVANVVSKLGTSPAQSTDVAAVVTKLGTPAQTADVAAIVTRLGAAPAQTADVSAIGVILQSILTTLQATRSEQILTDDSGAYYVRVDTPGVSAPSFYTLAGAASAAPGTGVRPAAGTTVTTTFDAFRAVNTGTGYAAGDFVKHIENTNPSTGAVIGQFWLNTSQGTKLASAPLATDLQLLDPSAEGAATLTAQLAGNTILSALQTALATLHTDLQTNHADLVTLHGDSGSTLHNDLASLLVSLGAPSDAASATTVIGLAKALLARNPALGTALMAGATPVTLATDDKLAVAIGGANDTAATSDGGTFSLVALVKRGLGNWTTLLGRIPALGAVAASASIPVGLATDQLATLAKDGADATGATMPAGARASAAG